MKKKITALILAFAIIIINISPGLAISTLLSTEVIPVNEALQDSEIVSFIEKHDETGLLDKIYSDIEQFTYSSATEYLRVALNDASIDVDTVQTVTETLNLDLPTFNNNHVFYVSRDATGAVVDLWYLYYTFSQSAFEIHLTGVMAGNTLDSIQGTLTKYRLNGNNWVEFGTRNVNITNASNGTIFTWLVSSQYVKEKIEYKLTVLDNGGVHYFNNIGEDSHIRYNFVAGPYNAITPMGGDRHHFIPAASLRANGYDSGTAYAIRMVRLDHHKTGSYGSSSYVSECTSLLANKEYLALMQHEVNDLKSIADPDGRYTNLQTKYYYEIVECALAYDKLFGSNLFS